MNLALNFPYLKFVVFGGFKLDVGFPSASSDQTQNFVLDGPEKANDAAFYPRLESADPPEGDGHLVGLVVAALFATWENESREKGVGKEVLIQLWVSPPMSEKLLSNKAKKRLRMTRFPTRTVAKK